jgi:hypothetical protein
MFYKAVVQAVLLYGCETWVVTPAMMRVLEGFHHKVARRISGKMARLTGTGWYYPPIAEALDEAGLHPIREYIRRRQATIEQYVATRPIFARCQAAPWRPGSSRFTRWCQQDHSDPRDPVGDAGAGAAAAPGGGAGLPPGGPDGDEDDGIEALATLFGESDDDD